MPPSASSKSIKLARLAISSAEIPPLANVWTKGTSQFLIVGEINLPYATAQAVGSSILARLDELWFAAPSALDTSEEIMEYFLSEINKSLSNLFAPYTFNPQAPRYHIVAAYFRYPEVCVSSIGNASAFVISPTRFTNIIKSSVTDDQTSSVYSKKPIFQQLITGVLKPNEALFLTNPGILDYFSVEKLRQIINQSNPGEAAAIIDNMLKDLDRQPAVSLIILKIPSRQELAGVAESVDQLLKTQSSTAGILRPKLWGYLKSGVNKLLPNSIKTKKAETVVTTNIKAQKPTRRFKLFALLQKIWLKIISIRIPWRRSELKQSLENLLVAAITKFKGLPRAHQALVVIVIALIFTFSYSIVSSGRVNFTNNISKNYNQLIAQIADYRNEIEASLIYNDDSKIAELLNEVRGLMTQLPQKTKEQQLQYESLAQTFNLLSMRVLKQTEILNPEISLDLAVLEQKDWQGLIMTNTLVAYSNNGRLAAKSSDGSAKNLLTLSANLGTVKRGSALNNESALFISTTAAAWLTDFKSNTSTTVDRQLPKLLDLSKFDGSRLYLLGDSPRTIYRLDINGTTVASPSVWLAASQGELAGATSLAVDGAIYVLRNGATIEKYIRGTKRDFTVSPISPELSAATKITTSVASEYIFILEPSTKRVVILDKEGKLVIQFVFSSLNGISDITIDGENNELYLLSGDKVYRTKIADYMN